MSPAAWTLLATCLTCVVLRAVHGYQYIGCFADSANRDLPLEAEHSGSMTVQRCNSLCTTRKYPYFGVQAGHTCFCGNGFGKYGPRPFGECSRGCNGNGNQMCGNDWRNSMYTSDFEIGLRYIGCYEDSAKRDFRVLAAEGSMSNTKCYTVCKEKKFAYFGTQNSHECWCGNSYGRHGPKPNEECNARCNGDPNEVCGGPWRNSVFATGLSPLRLPPSDPLHPRLRDQLAARIKALYTAFPKDVLCTTCLINAWHRRDVLLHNKVILAKDLNTALTTYPTQVKQKVLSLKFGTSTIFEDTIGESVGGAIGKRRTYVGFAKRLSDKVQLVMVDSYIEAQLATNYNVYYKQICYKILWIFTKCDTHKVQEIRGHEPNEVILIKKAMESEIYRFIGEHVENISA